MSSLKRPYEFGRATFYPLSDIVYCLKLAAWFCLIIILVSLPLYITAFFGWDLIEGFGWIFALILGLIYWAAYASYITAFHKRAMKGEDGGLFPFRFGNTEIQVMMVQLVWFLAVLMIYILISLGFGIINLIGVGIASAGGAMGIFGGVLIVLSMIGTFLTVAYVMGRLCTVTPMTVFFGQFTFSDSTKATENRAWWIVLSYIVLGIIYLIVYSLGFILILPILGGDVVNPYQGSGMIGAVIGLAISFCLLIVMQMYSGIGAYLTTTFYGQSDVEKIASLYD